MSRRSLVAVAALTLSLISPFVALAQLRAPDGVTVNEDGLPRSLDVLAVRDRPGDGPVWCGGDHAGAVCRPRGPHVRAGVGAVCTQASTMVEYGPRGLDLLAKGVLPADVLQQLMADDKQRESRQVGLIDMQGRSAAHTGSRTATGPAASRAGTTPCRPTSWSGRK